MNIRLGSYSPVNVKHGSIRSPKASGGVRFCASPSDNSGAPEKINWAKLNKALSYNRDILICAIAAIPCLLFPPLSPLFIGLAILAMWLLDRSEKKAENQKDFQDSFVQTLPI